MLNTGYNTLIIYIILRWHWLLKNKIFKLGKFLSLAVNVLLVIAQNIAAKHNVDENILMKESC